MGALGKRAPLAHFLVVVLWHVSALAALPDNYESLTGPEKRDILWTKVAASPYTVMPTENPGTLSALNLFRPSFLVGTFTAVTDEFGPADRQKLLLTYGATAKVNFEIFPRSPYTGVFQSGGPALARLSLGKYDPEKFTPGMAVKVLVDGHPSVNMVSLNSLDGQGPDRNFFANVLWNIIADPSSVALKLVQKAFALSLKLIPGSEMDRPEWELIMPLYELVAVDTHGNVPAHVVAPHRIGLVPIAELGWASDINVDFRTHLGRLRTGTVIYKISTKRTPESEDEIIGQVVLESEIVASQYQDAELFFQHAA